MINDTFTYPDPQIDPKKKDKGWLLQYCKAAFAEGRGYIPQSMLWFGRSRLTEIREYALGKQSVDKYKKILLGKEQSDKSWLNIDWTPPSFLTKFREIAIAKLLQRKVDIQAFAIDPLAKSEEDAFFNEMKVKIMMREQLQEVAPELANTPALMPNPNEPQDMEQLQMQMEYGYKHVMAMEAENAIALVLNKNGYEDKRKRVIENLFDFGIGGYKEWIDDNGMVCYREVNPENLITNFCVKNDFSDLVHVGEVILVNVADLVPYFDPKTIEDICRNVAGKFGNPSTFSTASFRYWDKFKVQVLDLELITWDTTVYKKEIDGRSNLRVVKSDFQNIARLQETIEVNGSAEPKYIDQTKKVVYKCKWLLGTDYLYDYGLSNNMKRKQSSWWDTSLSYHLYAWNFYNMMFTGITERLIPIQDALCLTWYKLQNLRNKLIPYIINLDLNAVESLNFGKGGEKMRPDEAVDFMFNNFIALYRSTDLLSKNPNYKPVSIESSGQLIAFRQLYEDMQTQLQMMRDISGLNELTDGSTPNAKTLVPVAQAAMESTNNALYLISHADRQLMQCLADGIVQRVQIAVKMGKIEGYARALGSDTVNFFKINPDLSLHEFGIFVEDAPSYEEKQMLLSELNLKDSQGLIDPADKILVMSCRNLKQAAMLLAYKVKKRREQMEQFEMQKIQQQQMGSIQAAQAAEAAKMESAQMLTQLEIEKINVEKQWDYITEKMKKESDLNSATIQAEARVLGNKIMADAKEAASSVKEKTSKK